LSRATFAQRVVLIPASVNSRVRIFLKRFLFRHAIFARRDTFLQAAANFLLDSRCPRVFSFRFWQRYLTRFRILRRFLGIPTSIVAASRLGIS
jgi:hypothetical protein